MGGGLEEWSFCCREKLSSSQELRQTDDLYRKQGPCPANGSQGVDGKDK